MLWGVGVEEGVGEGEGRVLVVAGLWRAGSHGLEELEAVPGEGGVAGTQVVAGEGGGESRQEEQERRGAVPQAGLWGCGRSHGGAVGGAGQEPGRAGWWCVWAPCLGCCRAAGFMWCDGFPFLAFRLLRVSGCGFQFWLVAVVVLGKCVVGVAVRVWGAVAVLCWWCAGGRLAVAVEWGMRKRWGRALGGSCGGEVR